MPLLRHHRDDIDLDAVWGVISSKKLPRSCSLCWLDDNAQDSRVWKVVSVRKRKDCGNDIAIVGLFQCQARFPFPSKQHFINIICSSISWMNLAGLDFCVFVSSECHHLCTNGENSVSYAPDHNGKCTLELFKLELLKLDCWGQSNCVVLLVILTSWCKCWCEVHVAPSDYYLQSCWHLGPSTGH